MSRALVPLAGGGFALLVYAIGSWIFSSRLIAQSFEPGRPADFTSVGLPEPERVTIPGEGVTLAGWYFANPRREECAVVLLHGFGANKEDTLSMAPLFWERGCDLLLYDARGHGGSSPAYATFGGHERKDLLRAIDWLTSHTGLPRSRVGVAGWSYGAATAIQAAPHANGVAFVLADSSYSSLEDISRVQARSMFGDWSTLFVPGALAMASVRAGFDAWDAAPERAIQRAQVPVLLVHSRQDSYIPVEQAELIYANGDPSRTELAIPEWPADHVGSRAENAAGYAALVDRFLDRFAPGFGRRLPG